MLFKMIYNIILTPINNNPLYLFIYFIFSKRMLYIKILFSIIVIVIF
jgi:hypothetical protein